MVDLPRYHCPLPAAEFHCARSGSLPPETLLVIAPVAVGCSKKEEKKGKKKKSERRGKEKVGERGREGGVVREDPSREINFWVAIRAQGRKVFMGEKN